MSSDFAYLASTKIGAGTSPGINTTGAKLLVAVVVDTPSTSPPTDSQGNTWIPLTEYSSDFGGKGRMYYVLNPTTNASHTFTTTGGLTVAAYSCTGTPALGQAMGVSNNGGVNAGSLTPYKDNCLLVAGITGTAYTATIDGGFTRRQVDTTGFSSSIADLAQTTAAAASPTWAGSTNANAAFLAYFKLADAVIISNGTGGGPATTGSSWVGGVAPTDGNLAYLADGDTISHASGTWTIGDGDPTHHAIRTLGTGGTGILNVTGGTLVLKASVLQGNATWSITGTPVINYTDDTDGTWTIADAHNQSNARLVLQGTSDGSRITVQATSTGKLSFTTASLQGGLIRAQYVNFSGITGSGGYGFLSWPTNNANQEWFLNCSFDGCSHFDHLNGAMAAGAVCRIEDTQWTNTVSDQCIGAVLAADNALSGGTRTIIGNGFDKGIGTVASSGQWRDFTCYGNFFGGRLLQFSAATKFAAFYDNFVVSPGGSITLNWYTPTLATQRNYLHFHDQAGQILNLHALTPFASMRGFILEPGNTDTTGDIFMLDGTTATLEIAYNLMLPNSGGDHAGQFISALGAAGMAITAIHNTFPTSGALIETGSISYGEGYGGHADMFPAIKSNIAWSPNGSGYLFTRRINRTVSNGCQTANITHNAISNCSAGNLGFPGFADEGTDGTFAAMFAGGGPNANGVTTAPAFAAPTRRLTTWAVARSYSSASTYNNRTTDAWAALKADPRNRIPDLISYVSDGWKSTNADYEDAGADGVTIGSEGYTVAVPTTTRRGMDNRRLRPF